MYFITCFSKCERNERGFFCGGAQRTFGYMPTFEEAEKALNTNACDLFECLYEYAVVEKIGPYIHPDVEEEVWFQWDNDKRGFYRIEKPKASYGTCNFAIG